MRRALIACGGTGGHLAPGIALAEELVSREWECEFLISGKQVDSRLVQKYKQFKYDAIAGSGLSFHPKRFFRFARDLLSGYRTCARKINSNRPDAVICFGGFISASALIAGVCQSVPVAIHEANQIPGRVTRLASRLADRIYLPFGVDLPGSRGNRIYHVGMPVRSEFKKMPKSEAKRIMGFDSDKKLLLIFGGSQGAQSLNKWTEESVGSLINSKIQVLCLTGMSGPRHEIDHSLSDKADSVKVVYLDFSDQMSTILSAADVAVSRAGAGSIAELIRCRLPSILIPYPYAADNHQYYNAKRFESDGGGIALQHEALDELIGNVIDLINDDAKLRRLESNLESMDRLNAQCEIADDLERILNLKGSVVQKGVSVS